MSNKEIQDNRRVESFIKEYGELVQKYEVDLMAVPTFQPDEKGGWQVRIQSQPVDLKELKKQQLDKAFISK